MTASAEARDRRRLSWTQQFENTLGRLLHEIKNHVAIPDEVSALLGEALSKRNWLAHGYFWDRAADFMTDSGCVRMISELEMVQEVFEGAVQKLDAIVRPIRERFGLTDEAIAAEASNLVREADDQDRSDGLNGAIGLAEGLTD